MPGERGDHCVARFAGRVRARESGRFKSISARGGFLLQNLRSEVAPPSTMTISGALRHLCRSPGCDHKWLAGAEFRGFVLIAPLSSVICR